MDIYECQRRAEREGYDKATFDLVNPANGMRLKCRWLDAYFGMFIPEGQDGFLMASSLDGTGFVCENFDADPKTSEPSTAPAKKRAARKKQPA